jgi:hypothetical protein
MKVSLETNIHTAKQAASNLNECAESKTFMFFYIRTRQKQGVFLSIISHTLYEGKIKTCRLKTWC